MSASESWQRRAATVAADPGLPHFCARCGAPIPPTPLELESRPTCRRCGWTYYAKNATGAAVLMEQDHAVLLVCRKNSPYRGWWHLPSGFVEYGESADLTALRETEEETGLQVELTGLFGVFYGADDPRNPAHLIVYLARVVGGQLQAGDDAADVAFFPFDRLPEQIAFEANRAALAHWRQQHDAAH